jgi:hypothetical protein
MPERQIAIETGPSEPSGFDHQAVRELLSEYRDGTLRAPLANDVRAHLEHCPSCRAFLRTLEATIEAIGHLPRHRLADGAKRRITDRLYGLSIESAASGGDAR